MPGASAVASDLAGPEDPHLVVAVCKMESDARSS